MLRLAGLVEVVHEQRDAQDAPGYMVRAAGMIWKAGDGSEPLRDPVSYTHLDVYKRQALCYAVGRDHTPGRARRGAARAGRTAGNRGDGA